MLQFVLKRGYGLLGVGLNILWYLQVLALFCGYLGNVNKEEKYDKGNKDKKYNI